MPDCNRGADGGANGDVSDERCPSRASPNSLQTQRPALVCAGRAGLRIESSTTELRWPRPVTHLAEVPVEAVRHTAWNPTLQRQRLHFQGQVYRGRAALLEPEGHSG